MKKENIISRRSFIKGLLVFGASVGAGAGTIGLFPKEISDRKVPSIFKGNLLDLYDMRALAILDRSPYLRALDDLCYRISMECINFDELNKTKDMLTDRCLLLINKFRKQPPTLDEFYRQYNESFKKYFQYLELPMINNSKFLITHNQKTKNLFLNSEKFEISLLDHESDAIYHYLSAAIKLKKTRFDKKAPAQFWRAANAIHNCSIDMPDLKGVADKSGLDLEDLLSIATMESMGLQFIVGRTGEIGRFQINPDNIPRIYKRPELQYSNEDQLIYDCIREAKVNATLAAMILKDNNKGFPHDIASYNGGKYGERLIKNVDEHKDKPQIRYVNRFSMYLDIIESREFLQN